MGYGRTPFNSDGATPFSIELPPGLIVTDFSELDPQPVPLKFVTVVAFIAAVNGPASIVLSQLSAKDRSSLMDVAAMCASERGAGNPSWNVESIGGEMHRHPGLQAEVRFGCEFVLFEDGGQILILEATGASDIWREYEPFLKRAMLSIELSAPLGPTLPLEVGNEVPQLLPGMPDPDSAAATAREADLSARAVEAKRLIEAGQFQDAENLVADVMPAPKSSHFLVACMRNDCAKPRIKDRMLARSCFVARSIGNAAAIPNLTRKSKPRTTRAASLRIMGRS